MNRVVFNAYFEDMLPVVEIISSTGTIKGLEKALKESGMFKLRPTIYVQERGGLNIKLLKNKMKKLGFDLKRTMITGNSKAFLIPDTDYFDYIHFIPGIFIDTVTVNDDVYYFYKNGTVLTAYKKAWCPEHHYASDKDINPVTIENNLGGQILITIYEPVNDHVWFDINYEKACSIFEKKYPGCTNFKQTVFRYYHTVEKIK